MTQPDYVEPNYYAADPHQAPYPQAYPNSYAGSYAPVPYERPSTPNPLAPWALGFAIVPPLIDIALTLLISPVGFVLSMLTTITGWCAAGLGVAALILGSGRRPEHRGTGMAVWGMLIGLGWSYIDPFVSMALIFVVGPNY